MLLLLPLASPMELVRSGWTRLAVLELRPDSLTVLLIHLDSMTVVTSKMPESLVKVCLCSRCSDDEHFRPVLYLHVSTPICRSVVTNFFTHAQ